MRWKRFERTYDHGRGEFTLKGVALGGLFVGKNVNRDTRGIAHAGSGYAISGSQYWDRPVRMLKKAAERILLEPGIDWTGDKPPIVPPDTIAVIKAIIEEEARNDRLER